MQHFSETAEASLLDRAPFTFKHKLADHPTLTVESLARIIPELPARCFNHSKGLDSVALNFDRSFQDHQNGLSLMQSFERLQQLPIDLVKIDGSFVRNVAGNPRDRDLVRAMVTIARAYQAETVAEYVETEPEDAKRAERVAKRGPHSSTRISVDELVAKGRNVFDRVRPYVQRVVSQVRQRIARGTR